MRSNFHYHPVRRARFRTGRVVASSSLLDLIPRDAIIRAIVKHALVAAIEGLAVYTAHQFGGIDFNLFTTPERDATHIRLDGEDI